MRHASFAIEDPGGIDRLQTPNASFYGKSAAAVVFQIFVGIYQLLGAYAPALLWPTISVIHCHHVERGLM